MQPEMMMQNATLQSNHHRSNIFRSKSDSVLWRRNEDRFELNQLLKDNINLIASFDVDKSTTDIPNAKLQTHQLSNNKNHFLYKSESPCQTSLSLPAIPILFLDLFFVKNETNESENDKNIHTIYIDKETLFNQSSEIKDPLLDLQCSINTNIVVCHNNSKYKLDQSDSKEQMISSDTSKIKQSCEEVIDSQIQTNNETLNEKNQSERDLCKQNRSNSTLTLNMHAQNNLMSRPTLVDDSKLVKMSLLTNPMNIMQSNVQLLNKSRNFLNFITEKSTNIMEKALLPQHLAMKYNHVSKSIETDTTTFYNEPCLKDTVCKSDINVTTNSSNALNVTIYTMKQNHSKTKDELDSAVNNRNDIDSSACIKDKIYDLENEAVPNEKKYIFEKSDVDGLNCDITDRQTKFDLLLTKINENKSNFLQMEKLLNNKENSSDICTSADLSISKYGSLEHPLYLMLLKDYTSLKIKHSKLLEKMEYLEKLNQSNKSFKDIQTNTDVCTLKVDILEKTINKLKTDLNASLAVQETLRNECTMVNKEKESMVMKYVSSEKQLIDSQRYV